MGKMREKRLWGKRRKTRLLSKERYEYVLRGAILTCTHGNKEIRLDALEDHGVYFRNQPVMTCKDCKLEENIFSFGACGNAKYQPVYSATAPPPAEEEKDNSGVIRQKCIPILLREWGYGDIDDRHTVLIRNDGGSNQYAKDPVNDKQERSGFKTHIKELNEGKGEEEIKELIDEYDQALMTCDNLLCLYGGVITIEENPEPEEKIVDEENLELEFEEEYMLVTMKQMNEFKFSITEEELKELNELLKDYNIADKGSIALFLATCGHESAMGTKLLEDGDEEYFISNGYTSKTRGAGYLHITKDDQEKFYKDVLKRDTPENPAQDIADNYAWLSAVWEWGECAKGKGVIMNDYVEKNGSGENIFLITQYFINSYLKKEEYPLFDSDLGSIRAGGEYVCSFDAEELKVRGRTYSLPKNYEDRKSKYDEAIRIFMQEDE